MISKRIQGLKIKKALPLGLILLQSNLIYAQANSQPAATGSDFSYIEVLGSVGAIIAIILIAWFMVGKQSKPEIKSGDHSGSSSIHRRHFDHPNDPHFRKLRKKTS